MTITKEMIHVTRPIKPHFYGKEPKKEIVTKVELETNEIYDNGTIPSHVFANLKEDEELCFNNWSDQYWVTRIKSTKTPNTNYEVELKSYELERQLYESKLAAYEEQLAIFENAQAKEKEEKERELFLRLSKKYAGTCEPEKS